MDLDWFKPVGYFCRTLRGTNAKILAREVMRKTLCVYKLDNPKLPRKVSTEVSLVSVPKPTQVGEEKILRRLREPSLRNSAK